jgi:hypothetical protein
MTMNTAEDTDEETAVQPIRIHKKGETGKGKLPSKSTIDGYIKAAMDLFTEQVNDPTNQAINEHVTSPRSKQLAVIMEEFYVRLGKQNSLEDVPRLSLEDGHDVLDLKELLKGSWAYNFRTLDGPGRGKKGLRNRLSFSWNHFLACRGENLRFAVLTDLFPHDFTRSPGTQTAQEGGQQTTGVVLQMLRGKTNKDANRRFGSIIRNVDVEMCPVGALAFYLLEKWVSISTLVL